MTAHAASPVLGDMIGAARLKAKYGIMEYEDDDDDSRPTDYYHYYLTHRDNEAIPEGKYVSVVRVEGVMMRDEGWCQPGTRDLAEWLKKAFIPLNPRSSKTKRWYVIWLVGICVANIVWAWVKLAGRGYSI